MDLPDLLASIDTDDVAGVVRSMEDEEDIKRVRDVGVALTAAANDELRQRTWDDELSDQADA